MVEETTTGVEPTTSRRDCDGFFVLYGLLALALSVGTFGVGMIVGLVIRLQRLAILTEYIR